MDRFLVYSSARAQSTPASRLTWSCSSQREGCQVALMAFGVMLNTVTTRLHMSCVHFNGMKSYHKRRPCLLVANLQCNAQKLELWSE